MTDNVINNDKNITNLDTKNKTCNESWDNEKYNDFNSKKIFNNFNYNIIRLQQAYNYKE